MTRKTLTKILLNVLRYGLCAAAIVYLILNVHWYDTIHLDQPGKPRVRLLEVRDDGYVIQQDGAERTIALKEAAGQPEFGIKSVVQNIDVSLALLSFLVFLPVPLLQSLRLVWMLAIQEVRISYWAAVKLSYAGNFFNFALPGTTGGDLVKAYYVTAYTHHKTEAVTTVVLDRVVGVVGLAIFAGGTFVLSLITDAVQWRPDMFKMLAVALSLLFAGLIAVSIVLFSSRLRAFFRLPQLVAMLPAAEQIQRIGKATVAIRHHPSLMALSLGNTLVLQALFVFATYFMARALGMHGGFLLYFVCIPITAILAALPIAPPQGFGLVEWAYIQFFAEGGLNTAQQAFAFALGTRLIQLVWALPGVLVPLLGAHVPSRAELAEFEQPGEAPLSDAGEPVSATATANSLPTESRSLDAQSPTARSAQS